jgi:hypothetical protein
VGATVAVGVGVGPGWQPGKVVSGEGALIATVMGAPVL